MGLLLPETAGKFSGFLRNRRFASIPQLFTMFFIIEIERRLLPLNISETRDLEPSWTARSFLVNPFSLINFSRADISSGFSALFSMGKPIWEIRVFCQILFRKDCFLLHKPRFSLKLFQVVGVVHKIKEEEFRKYIRL